MSYVKFNFNNIEQIISFDETIGNHKFIEKLTKDFSLKEQQGQILFPTVKVSTMRPTNIQAWTFNPFNKCDYIKIYTRKIQNKLHFYIQVLDEWDISKTYFNTINIIFYSMLVSNMLRNDLIRLHSVLLNNGDVIFGSLKAGKTTLSTRINKNNNLKTICNDGVLIDFKNNLVYPLPLLGNINRDRRLYDYSKPLKLNRLIFLQRSEDEELITIDKSLFREKLILCSKIFLAHPFLLREQEYNSDKNQRWTDPIEGLREQVQDRIEQIIDQYIDNFEPLSVTTNTNSTSQKFEVFEDK